MRKKCVEIKGDKLLFCLISSSRGEPRVFYDSTLFAASYSIYAVGPRAVGQLILRKPLVGGRSQRSG